MTLLTRDEALRLTEPFHEEWLEAHRGTIRFINQARTANPALFLPLKEAELCAIAHRHVFERVSSRVRDGVVPTDRLGFNALIVDGRALVRFKHLDVELAPSAYRTRQQQHLEKQEYTEDMMEQLAEDGVDAPPTLLNCGYRMSPTWDRLEQVAVVCWYRGQYQYHYDLHNEAGETGGEIVYLPGTPPPAPRIIPKEAKEPAEAGDQGKD